MRPEPPEYVDLLSQRPEAVAGLARRLRATILREFPDLTERYYPGWQGLGLKHPAGGLLGTVFPREADVVVYLEHGAVLPDPLGLLGGAERLRRTRTLTFHPDLDTPSEEHLVEYLDLAVEHALAQRGRRPPGVRR